MGSLGFDDALRTHAYLNIKGGAVADDAAFEPEFLSSVVGLGSNTWALASATQLRVPPKEGTSPGRYEIQVSGRWTTPAGQNVLLEIMIGGVLAVKLFGYSDPASDSAPVHGFCVAEIATPSASLIQLVNRSGVNVTANTGYCRMVVRRLG
jgi:hypothetical protein